MFKVNKRFNQKNVIDDVSVSIVDFEHVFGLLRTWRCTSILEITRIFLQCTA